MLPILPRKDMKTEIKVWCRQLEHSVQGEAEEQLFTLTLPYFSVASFTESSELGHFRRQDIIIYNLLVYHSTATTFYYKNAVLL